MRYKDLAGEEHKVNLAKKKKRGRRKSKLHLLALDTIKEISPLTRICEEVPIRIRRGHTLYLDIFLPDFNIAVEVQGRQHFEYIHTFHKYKHRFGRAKLNDDLKREWCTVNNVQLVELRYNDTDEWHDRLSRTIG